MFGPTWQWLKYVLGLTPASTQTTPAERECLKKYATGKRSLVEIGVMQGVNTGLLRGVMDPAGIMTGIDPHPNGRWGCNLDRWVAHRELRRYSNGQARLLRKTSEEAVKDWQDPIDFIFIDGDHSWAGIEHDWKHWTPFVEAGGIVALHDTRAQEGWPDHDTIRFMSEVISRDTRFGVIEEVDSLTIVKRVHAEA